MPLSECIQCGDLAQNDMGEDWVCRDCTHQNRIKELEEDNEQLRKYLQATYNYLGEDDVAKWQIAMDALGAKRATWEDLMDI